MWDNPFWSELWKDWPDLFLSESNMWFCLVSSISPCPTFLPHVYLVAMKSDIDFAFAIKGNTLSAESTVFLTSNPGVATKTFLRPLQGVLSCVWMPWVDLGRQGWARHLLTPETRLIVFLFKELASKLWSKKIVHCMYRTMFNAQCTMYSANLELSL